MRIALGAVRLTDIINGTLAFGTIPNARFVAATEAFCNALEAGGIVPWSQIQKLEDYDVDSGGTGLIQASSTEILELDAGTLVAGDYVFLTFAFEGTCGQWDCEVHIGLEKKSGTGNVDWPNYSARVGLNQHVFAAEDWHEAVTLLGKCTTPGTYVCCIKGQTTVVNAIFTLPANAARAYLRVV